MAGKEQGEWFRQPDILEVVSRITKIPVHELGFEGLKIETVKDEATGR